MEYEWQGCPGNTGKQMSSRSDSSIQIAQLWLVEEDNDIIWFWYSHAPIPTQLKEYIKNITGQISHVKQLEAHHSQ